jgi:predicted anti-sigma-YlaC factor YlaD
MTCREVADFISDYLAGQLPGEIAVPFEHHLSRCPNCVNYISSLRSTIDLSRRAFEQQPVDPPLPMPEELVQAILAARRPNRPGAS